MNEFQKNAIKECSYLLAKNMERIEILVFLISKNVLTHVQKELIEANNTNFEKNYCLIDMLTKAGPDTFHFFIEALKISNQEHLSNEILNAVTKQQAKQTQHLPSELSQDTCKQAVSALKDLYKKSFQKVNPFSLPFTFSIERTWISLALNKNWSVGGQERVEDRRIENHNKLIEEAFTNGNELLLIEGRAASGKTSLLRRIAYDWAIGNLDAFNIVFYVEFRNIGKQIFNTIAEMIRDGFQHMEDDTINRLIQQICPAFCKENSILLLFDGFDEARVKVPCMELSDIFAKRGLKKSLNVKLIISTRPGPLSDYMGRHDILNSATVIGFDKMDQKLAYIQAHFHFTDRSEEKIGEVEQCLKNSQSLNTIAETPLFLVFICLVYDKIKSKTVFELYRCIIWWLIDRYQTDNPLLNVSSLFGFKTVEDENSWRVIQDHFLEFPLLGKLGRMSLEMYESNQFSKMDLKKFDIDDIIEKVGFLVRQENEDDWQRKTQFVFPHRTIQEFLAGGMFYFWSDSDTSATDSSFTEKIFIKDAEQKLNAIEKECRNTKSWRRTFEIEMGELEKFIWRAALSLDEKICTRLKFFLQKYKSLFLDLFFVILQSGTTETDAANRISKILSYCHNVDRIVFYLSESLLNDENIKVIGRINLSSMQRLQNLIFYSDNAKSKLRMQTKNNPTSDLTCAHIPELPDNNIITQIIFDKWFSYAKSFIATMRHLAEHLRPEAKFLLKSEIYFTEDENKSVHYVSVILNVQTPPSILNKNQNSIFETVLNFVSLSVRIDIYGKVETSEFCIRFPMLPNLKVLCLHNFLFSSFEAECRSVFSTMNNLEELCFERCEIELSAMQGMVSNLCNNCLMLTKLTFTEHQFRSPDDFKELFRILQECGSIEEIYIGRPTIEQVNEMSTFDATETFCDLVKHLKCLQKLTLSDSYLLYCNVEKIEAAAFLQENFECTLIE